jgi:hypothetical protein
MVSSAWSQSGQQGGCGSPLHANLSSVQDRSWQASQMWNLTLGGEGAERQLSLQDLDTIAPLKEELIARLGRILRILRPSP